ncbi:MAG: single-stranded-DNA-specific exonuclease RecJ [Bryobacteraceae bacterium]|nr:single-stranded-DNA-specific exonuclease RecJ [Bryobacteraceae bacterium]
MIGAPARWVLPRDVEREAKALSAAVGIALPAARVLAARGYGDPDKAREFLTPHTSQLHDPTLLLDLPQAAARLQSAIRAGEKILLYGDYDVDGTLAVVILTKAIEVCGGKSEYHVPHRLLEGYGMRPEVVEKAASEGVKLIVSVDTGIRAGAVVEHANALGIDCIVTDHHLPEATQSPVPEAALPPALAVINPNRPDCEYPNKNLCGAAVAYKLAVGLMRLQTWDAAKLDRMSDSFLKLAAIATVSDVMPLVGENRAIVTLGLAGFDRVRNPGLRALLAVAGIEEGTAPTVRQVGFQIGPRINAAGRLESARQVVEMFLTGDEKRAAEIAKDLDALNFERRSTEKRILEECLAAVDESRAGLVLAGEGWHRGVVGIVASRVVERFHRPVLVLERNLEQGVAQGSGRSIEAFHLLDALESMRDLFQKFGGHSHAAGVTLDLAKLDEFVRRFDDYAKTKLTEEDFRPQLRIDAEASAAEWDESSVADVMRLAPFGNGNPMPVFLLRAAKIGSATPMGESGKHFKIRFEQNGAKLFAKAWNFDERAGEIMPGVTVDAAVTVEDDSYWGWSASVKDVRAIG